jgi:hypothetical protein
MRDVTTPPDSTAPCGSALTPAPSHDDIARRAYEIYVKKGCQQGQCKQNWRQAEQDLGGQGQATCAAPACDWGQTSAPVADSSPVAKTIVRPVPSIPGAQGATHRGRVVSQVEHRKGT